MIEVVLVFLVSAGRDKYNVSNTSFVDFNIGNNSLRLDMYLPFVRVYQTVRRYNMAQRIGLFDSPTLTYCLTDTTLSTYWRNTTSSILHLHDVNNWN